MKNFDLPRQLDDGLLLRWGTVDDIDAVADFNANIHSDSEEPEEPLRHWTRDLMQGAHPTTGAGDFTVVVDTRNDNKLVSTLCTISQTWCYDDITFGVGRPELVATLPEYRRRRLVRYQMEVIHARSAARGELVQAITGIPWYYRRFGYEMAIDLGGGRRLEWHRMGKLKGEQAEAYQLRPAAEADLALMQQLYEIHCRHSLISRERNRDEWLYELAGTNPASDFHPQFHIIETIAGEAVGYVRAGPKKWAHGMMVEEIAVLPGHSLRGAAEFLGRHWQGSQKEWAAEEERPPLGIWFHLGQVHPVYTALGRQLGTPSRPYAWYVRVADLTGFLQHIKPVLERRLAGSVMAGHSGLLRLNFYENQMRLSFEKGQLRDIGSYEPKYLEEGDARFPDLTFLQLLFGYRSREELDNGRADCFTNDEAAVLLDILFPKQPSQINFLG